MAQGDENALGFSLGFDPAIVAYRGAGAAGAAGGATMQVNATQAASGRLGFVLALPAGRTFAAGSRQVVNVSFSAPGLNPGSSPIALIDQPVPREVDDAGAALLAAQYMNGMITVNPMPELTIRRAGQALELAWPAWATNYVLQEVTGDISASAQWTNSTPPARVTNGQNTITLTPGNTGRFYRLYKP